MYQNITSIQIAAEIREEIGKDVHYKTVRRVLNKIDYNCDFAIPKPFLISKSKEAFRI